MKIKNRYRSKSDLNNMSKSEHVALSFVSIFYNNETEDTERIKEKSLPLHTLFNCVYTIITQLKSEEMPELFIDEIWDSIKHIRGKEYKESPLARLIVLEYEYNVNRWYEATIIFACVYVVMAIDCPDKEACLQRIKSKAAYNPDAQNYFNIFERKLEDLQNKMKENPDAYGHKTEAVTVEPKIYTEDEWLANEKHDSWRLDALKREMVGKPIEEQFNLYVTEFQNEKSLPSPSKIYLSLLEIQIRALQKQLSEKNAPTISINDILEVLTQNNFSNQKQAELLQIINYVLYAKQYPDDICGNLEKKIQILQQPIETVETGNTEKSGTKRTQKVTTDVLLSLLHKTGVSAASEDKAKIARLISYLTGFSEEKIRQRLSNSDELTSFHKEEIEGVNRILIDLNFDISIKYNKQR